MTTVSVIDSDTPGTTLIEQAEDSGVVSRSWHYDTIPVEARLNPDAPPAQDMREGAPPGATIEWAMPDAACWAVMTNSGEPERQAFRRAMIAAGRDVTREVGLIRR